ncbi:MAG: cell division protein FtsZ, partial [Ktedonobacterales bacterium]
NLDFADIRTVMADAGSALMSIGQASGENRAEEAARGAITNPLLDVDISGARGVVFNITGGDDLTMFEVNRIADIIAGAAHQDANIIFGTVYDQSLASSLKVTVVATGFEPRVAYDRQRQPWAPASASPAAPSGSRSATSAQSPATVSPFPKLRQSGEGDQGAGPAPAPDAEPQPYIRVGSPVRTPESFAVTPLARSQDERHETDGERQQVPRTPRTQRTDEQVRPARFADADRRAADQRGAPMPRGYHGDEYVENDEPEELDLPREPRHGWERLFTRR